MDDPVRQPRKRKPPTDQKRRMKQLEKECIRLGNLLTTHRINNAMRAYIQKLHDQHNEELHRLRFPRREMEPFTVTRCNRSNDKTLL